MNSIKIDLHTHSILSPDGGLCEKDYRDLLERKKLDCIAITDHNRVDFALNLHKKLGRQIIVGEEVMTQDGEIIGLFLKQVVPAGLSARETVKAIKKQDGLICVPHPFERLRHGLQENVLQEIVTDIDCLEVFNGRSLEPATRILAQQYVERYKLGPVANSDSHCRIGIGRTYSIIASLPDRKTLIPLLRKGSLHEQAVPKLAYLCPKMNRLKNLLFHHE